MKVTPCAVRSFPTNTLLEVLCGLLLVATIGAHASSARFAERIRFEQPHGSVIELRGVGNEFQAVYETLDGYTVVFDPDARAYCYATLSSAGDELLSTGLQVGTGDPQSLGLSQKLRIRPEFARKQVRHRQMERDNQLRLTERWSQLKAAQNAPPEDRLKILRYGPTIGKKCGLTLLIDFDEAPGTLARSNVVEFLNGDNYRRNGNNGSVKQYYADVSDGQLIYTNLVIGYIRIPKTLHPRSYYNDLNRDTFHAGNELIRDAISILTNQPNYMSEIVPRLDALSLNESGEILAANILVAGADSGVWVKGLWPHMSSLFAVGAQELWPGGTRLNMYQMTPTTFQDSALTLGAFCHETGHLLCGFPDIYDPDDQSAGGAGTYCLMNSYSSYTNPSHFCAYLKFMAGWATVTDLVPGPARDFTLYAPGTNHLHFLRYRPYLFSREYYLIENRQQSGRDAQIPGSGILVWHIDELGNSSNQNLLPNSLHANYEVTLVQADGRWNLQRNENQGDTTDPFYKGNPSSRYANRFSDSTTPGAGWWNGNRSGLEIRDISVKGKQMTLTAEVKPPIILRDPLSQTVPLGGDLFLSIQMATNQAYAYTWFKASAPLRGDSRVTGVNGPTLGLSKVQSTDAGDYFVVAASGSGNAVTSRVAQVTIVNLRPMASVDLGDANQMPGNTTTLGKTIYVTAGGSGLAGAGDGCRFLYESVRGDFDVKVKVMDMNPEDGRSQAFGRAGLMVRAGLAAGNRQAAVLIQPRFLDTGELQALARSSDQSAPVEQAWAGGLTAYNNWVRLKREGNLVSMYYSANGARWDWLNTIPLPLESESLVGMAVASDSPLVPVVAGLEGYSMQTNSPPTFAITSLVNSAREGTNERATLAVVSSRNGPTQIAYTIRDPAANGIMFETLDGQLTLPSGTNVALIHVVPLNDAKAAPPTIVTISLPASDVVQSSASAILFDDGELGHGLKKESYASVLGTAVTDLTRNVRFPGSCLLGTVPSFESTPGQNSGQVLSGYITPPITGPYTFYLASANAAELWLSSDLSPERAVKIAEELGTNAKRNWPGSVSQSHISAPVTLSQGTWYFIKAVHKAGLGKPHLGVAWQTPGGSAPMPGSPPISGEFLAWSLPVSRAGGSTPGSIRLTSASAGGLELWFDKPPAALLTLEGSSDLRQWERLLTNVFSSPLHLLDSDPTSRSTPQRYYRLVQP